jgi:flavin-dependent dehydrogenase
LQSPKPNFYDVLIAGAGPAGLSAAGAAARAGLRVAIFERSKEIGYPVHTSGGSWIAELRRLGVPDRFMHPIRTGKFLAPSATATFLMTSRLVASSTFAACISISGPKLPKLAQRFFQVQRLSALS